MIINANSWVRPSLTQNNQIATTVAKMLTAIRTDGDSAINQYAEALDGQFPQVSELLPFEDYQLEPQLAKSIKLAADRIEAFARFQNQQNQTRSFSDQYGTYSQQIIPIERVGAYVPAGRYPLISSALMTLIPAKVAGCPSRIAFSPSLNPAVKAAASLAGATQFVQLGGAQAIAAMAFGYSDIAPVDIIVGPGNSWVNEAKKQLQTNVQIDGLAGPSELLALCDGQQPIEWLALDALAQAEHDPVACSLLVSDDYQWLESMQNYLQNNSQMVSLLKNRQVELIYADSIQAMVNFSQNYAPEHLMLCHQKINREQLTHYGSLFIGANSAVALGDYISGPNHTLPTSGFARQNGGLSVNDFLKVITTQQLTRSGSSALALQAMPIAKAEGLEYHYQSLLARTSS